MIFKSDTTIKDILTKIPQKINDINRLLIGSFFWLSTGILIWTGSIQAIALWIATTIWFTIFLYIVKEISVVPFGYPGISIVNVIFNFFSRYLSLSAITLLISIYALILPAMAILFNWLLEYILGTFLNKYILYSTFGFLIFIYFFRTGSKKLLSAISFIQVISLLILFCISIYAINNSLIEGSFNLVWNKEWVTLPIFLGLMFFHFATFSFWSNDSNNISNQVAYKQKIGLIIIICTLQILMILALPNLLNFSDWQSKLTFLPAILPQLFGKFGAILISLIIIIQIIGNGIYACHSLIQLLESAIKLDYINSSGKHPWHLRNFRYSAQFIIFIYIIIMGILIWLNLWDLPILMYIGGVNIIVLAILFTISYLEKNTITSKKLGKLFLIFNIILLPFFGWLLLFSFSLLFMGFIIDFMRYVRRDELFIKSKSAIRFISKIKYAIFNKQD